MAGLTRRRLLHGLAAGAVASSIPCHASGQGAAPALSEVSDSIRAAMAAAAVAWLNALPSDARRRAVFGMPDKERENWHYVPRRREGVPFKEMPASARASAHELMKASLSGMGYGKAVNIFRLEEVLRRLETFGLIRDPDNYAFTVFGAPGSSAPWGWRLEGHHLSLNFTLVPGKPVAMTPAFFGANPAQVPSGPERGLRVLAAEQDMARALVQGLSETQRARTVIAAQSLGDIVTGPGRADSIASPTGLALADMSGDQRAQALRLVEEHARGAGRAGTVPDAAGGSAADPFRVGGSDRARQGALLPSPRPHAAHRVRQ